MSLLQPIEFDADIIEAAVSLCAGLGNRDVSAFAEAVRPLAFDDREARHDLARVAFREVYKRRTPCWIYFAQVNDSNLVKVGRSTVVESRLAALDRKHGIKHHVLGTIRGDYREEHDLHRYFRRHRVKNLNGGLREYFFLEPLQPTIDALLASGTMIELPLRPLP